METIDNDRSQFARNVVTMYAIKSGLTHVVMVFALEVMVYFSPFFHEHGVWSGYIVFLMVMGGMGTFFLRNTRRDLTGEMVKLFPDRKRIDDPWVRASIRKGRAASVIATPVIAGLFIVLLIHEESDQDTRALLIAMAAVVLFFIEHTAFVKEVTNISPKEKT